MTTSEVATAFRVSRQTVRRWGRAGLLPIVVVGRDWRFHRADVENLLVPQNGNDTEAAS